MLPKRIYETTPVQREISNVGLDIVKMRDLARLTKDRCPDEEFTDRLISACDSIEELTHLILFQGQYAAEFDLGDLITNRNYLRSSLDLPGVNSSVTSVMSGETTVTPRVQTTNSRTGQTRLLPPIDGWPISMWKEFVKVQFTAGGNVPSRVANAVAVQTRFDYYAEPNDALLLDWYASKLLVR